MQAAAHDGTTDVIDRRDVAAAQPVGIRHRRVSGLCHECAQSAQSTSVGIEQIGTPRAASAHQLGDEHAGDRAVGEPLSGVAGDDIDMVDVGAAPDERQSISGLDDLPRPPRDDLAGEREQPA
jgi:hypothetical protein